jgi:ribA/ribD-fused uncharacterized protein
MYESPVEFDGIKYRSAEAAFQAQKLEDKEKRKEYAGLSGKNAKARGRRAQLRPDWESSKLKVMEDILRAKFGQNPELMRQLIATGDADISEGNSWGDTYWGVSGGVGENNLGKLLMKIRAENQKPSGPMDIQYFARKGGGELKRYYKKAHSEVTAKATEIQNDPNMLDDQRAALLRILGKRGEELQRHIDALDEAGVTDSSPSEWEDERIAGEQAAEKAQRDWRLLDQQMSQEADAKHDLETIVNSLIYYDPANPMAEGV